MRLRAVALPPKLATSRSVNSIALAGGFILCEYTNRSEGNTRTRLLTRFPLVRILSGMDTSALECVWNGREGWVGRGERGGLLPAYDSRTPLAAAIRSEPRETRTRLPRQSRPGKRKYDDAMREAVRALRADGLILSDIAQRLEMPMGTVYHILQEGRTNP